MNHQESFYRRLLDIGSDMGRPSVDACQALCKALPRHPRIVAPRIQADCQYGPDERHRLDLYLPEEAGGAPRPVFVFVHGGGFVGGDKQLAGGYAYGNVGQWAVSQGMIGVAITYRLAPRHPWPAAADDVRDALAWVREHIADHGGDASRVVVCGHSAGAAHVAGYLARAQEAGEPALAAGVILMSGVYDVVRAASRQGSHVYYGDDPSLYERQTSIEALAGLTVPLLLVVAELDPEVFRQDALAVVSRYAARQQRMPGFVTALGHNHFTESYHLGSEDTRLGDTLAGFVRHLG